MKCIINLIFHFINFTFPYTSLGANDTVAQTKTTLDETNFFVTAANLSHSPEHFEIILPLNATLATSSLAMLRV